MDICQGLTISSVSAGCLCNRTLSSSGPGPGPGPRSGPRSVSGQVQQVQGKIPNMEEDLLSSSGQVQDWFRLLLKFNSLELDYEVRRLVLFLSQFHPPSKEKLRFNVCGLWIIIFMFSQSFLGQNIFLMNI